MSKKIYVIAGEASGDLHGANLIQNLVHHARTPLEIYGVGGEKIQATGAREFLDLAHFHVTGLTDAIKRLPQYQKAADELLKKIKEIRPDLVVLIDNPGFNLHLAKQIHRWRIPVVYYIAPQVWAWAPKRILKIKRYVTKVIVVFEFEKRIYEENGIPVAWVGHPLKDLIHPSGDSTHAREAMGIQNKTPLISLLPGSRKGELKILFPIFAKASKMIAKEFPEIRFALIKAPTLTKDFYERLFKENDVRFSLTENDAYEVIKASDLAIVCSGTATLECALLETPMIITNKGTFLTYLAAKSLIKVPYLGIPNLVLGEKKIPELLQYDATPKKIASEAVRILSDKRSQELMKNDLKEVSRRLGEPGATGRAALEVLKLL